MKLYYSSNNVLLEGNQAPCPATILIEDGIITNILLTSTPPPEVIREYMGEILGDAFIAPGVIDLNCNLGDDQLSQITQAHASNGVTTVVLPGQHFGRELYSDTAFLKVLSDDTVVQRDLEEGVIGFKAYLTPQKYGTPHIQSFDVINSLSGVDVPVFVNPEVRDDNRFGIGGMNSSMLSDVLEEESGSESNNSSIVSPIKIEQRRQSIKTYTAALDLEKINNISQDRRNTEMVAIRPFDLDFEPSSASTIYTQSSEDASPNVKKISVPDIMEELENRRRLSGQPDLLSYAAAEIAKKAPQINSIRRASSQLEVKQLPAADTSKRRNSNLGTIGFLRLNQENVNEKFAAIYDEHLSKYPVKLETDAVYRVLHLVNSGVRIHLANIASTESLQVLAGCSKDCPNLSFDVSMPHLYFHQSNIELYNVRYKSNPPIRDADNCKALWGGVVSGNVDAISSCHKSISTDKKFIGQYATVEEGISSAGFLLSGVWTQMRRRYPDTDVNELMMQLFNLLSYRPAEILGISSHKGGLAQGKHADFIVWNPFAQYKVEKSNVYGSFRDCSPFPGSELEGVVMRTYVRGAPTYINGRFTPNGKIFNRNNLL